MDATLKRNKILFLILFSLASVPVLGKMPVLTCSKTALNVSYINGVNTSLKRANYVAQYLDIIFRRTLIDEKDYQFVGSEAGAVAALYNSSPGLGSDLVTAGYLKVREQIGTTQPVSVVENLLTSFFSAPIAFGDIANSIGFDVRPLVDSVIKPALQRGAIADRELFINLLKNQAIDGQKVLIVSHSEGTLYANMVLEALKYLPMESKLKGEVFSSVMLGPAASVLYRNGRGQLAGEYTLNLTDIIVQGVSGLSSNVSIFKPLEDWSGHDVIDTYLNTNNFSDAVDGNVDMVTLFQKKTQRAISKMLSNREGCCGIGSEGQLWPGFETCSYAGCLGGFIAKEVVIPKLGPSTLQLDKNSQICGNVEISTERDDLITLQKTKLAGKMKVQGNVALKNVSFDASSSSIPIPATLVGNMGDGIRIELPETTVPNIIGGAQISGEVAITGDTSIGGAAFIEGSPKIEGRVTISNTRISDVSNDVPPDLKSTTPLLSIYGSNSKPTDIKNSKVLGRIEIKEGSKLDGVFASGHVFIENTKLTNVKMYNNLLNASGKPPLTVKKSSLCSGAQELIDSQLTGHPFVETCGLIENSKVSGHAEIRKKVEVSWSDIVAAPYSSSSDPLIITGSVGTDPGIYISAESKIFDTVLVEGDIQISGATLRGEGVYKGTYMLDSNSQKIPSIIAVGEYTGANDFSKQYMVFKGMSNTKVEGAYTLHGDGNYYAGFIWDTATIQTEVGKANPEFKGILSIGGTVGAETKLHGYSLGANTQGVGVVIEETSKFEGYGKKLHGSVVIGEGSYINDSDVTGSLINPFGPYVTHFYGGSSVTNSTVTGYAAVYCLSQVKSSSQLAGTGVSVEYSTLTGAYLSGNARVCGRAYPQGFSADSSHNCQDEEAHGPVAPCPLKSKFDPLSVVKLRDKALAKMKAKIRETKQRPSRIVF